MRKGLVHISANLSLLDWVMMTSHSSAQWISLEPRNLQKILLLPAQPLSHFTVPVKHCSNLTWNLMNYLKLYPKHC
uniref:Uncharacterized protein n=1 Tax=Salix viminalis TaxID=40686 RepID=A0A6N2LX84_SALVM